MVATAKKLPQNVSKTREEIAGDDAKAVEHSGARARGYALARITAQAPRG